MPFPIGNQYAKNNPNVGTLTKAEIIAEATSIKKLEIELARVLTALADKELTKEEYKTLVDAMDKINKNVQLLKGKPTENVKYTEENYDRAEEYFIQKTSSKNSLQK